MNGLMVINGVECYEAGGTAYLKLETVARGLGFTQVKNGQEYVRWDRVEQYLEEFGFPHKWGNADYIPENIFYRLAMRARNDVAEAFQAKIADDIIPTIRKTGSYSTHGIDPNTYLKAALEAANIVAKTNRDQLPYVISILRRSGIEMDDIPVQPHTASNGPDKTCVEPFLDDVLPRAKWDLLPFQTLYEMYVGWMERNRFGTKPCSKRKFLYRLADLMPKDGWEMPERGEDGRYRKVRTSDRMDADEPLLREYGLRPIDDPAVNYRGLVRVS